MIVFGNAGRKLYDDFVFLDPLFLLDIARQVCELSMNGPAAAAPARHVNHTIRLVPGIPGEAASPLIERFLTEIARAALLNNIALHYDNIDLIREIYHLKFPCKLRY